MKINLSINQNELTTLKELFAGGEAKQPRNWWQGKQSEILKILTKVNAAADRADKYETRSTVKVLEHMTWYVAEVSFRASNPIHRCIAFHRCQGNLELMASYEGIEDANIKSLAYFRPIQKLDAMDVKVEHFLPKDAPAVIFIEKP